MSERHSYVYILSSDVYGTLYIGVTADLMRRVCEHKQGIVPGFTKDHRVTRLVWYEQHIEIMAAITREKQIKKWRREWKVKLIQSMNPGWEDLYPEICR